MHWIYRAAPAALARVASTPFRAISGPPARWLSAAAAQATVPHEPSGTFITPFERAPRHALSDTTQKALALLSAQNRHYAILALRGRPYYVQVGDTLVVPHIAGVELGEVVRLHQAYELGSRDYLLQGNPFVDPRFFECRGTVIEHVRSQPTAHRKWRRKGHRKLRIHSTEHTLIRISHLVVNSAEAHSGAVVPPGS